LAWTRAHLHDPRPAGFQRRNALLEVANTTGQLGERGGQSKTRHNPLSSSQAERSSAMTVNVSLGRTTIRRMV
jgi:hypothetical protein